MSTTVYTPYLSQPEVARYFLKAGLVKHNSRVDVIFFKAFIAGIFLSFGGLLSEIVSGGSPSLNESNPGLVKVLGGFVFPVGLMMIVLQGQELLTSNMLIFPICVIKRVVPWWGLILNWFVVFFGNLVGSLFFAALLVRYSGIVSADPYASFIRTAAISKAITPQWHQIFLRGIGCNILVSIAVWGAAAAADVISKVFVIWIPIWVFVACSYDHVVANMYSLPLSIMLHSELTPAEYIKKSLFAAFFGNIVGALIIALPYTYFYLSDYHHGGQLDELEEGQGSGSLTEIGK